MCSHYTSFFLSFIILTTPSNAKKSIKKHGCAVQGIRVHLHNPVVGPHFTAPQPLPHFATEAEAKVATAVAAIIPIQVKHHVTMHNTCYCVMFVWY